MCKKLWNRRRILSVWLCICLIAGCIGIGIPSMRVQAADKVRVVGYLPSYRTSAIDTIDYSALTHLNLSFITYANGTLSCSFSDSDVARIREKCNANNVKLLIALGGGGGFDVSSGNPFETAEKRAALIDSLMGYVEKWQLDGIDIDIELSSGTSLWGDFDKFISELSARLKAEDKLLTMALAKWFAGDIQNSTYTYFDFVNLMTYDENAGNGPVASQSFVESTVAYFQGKGISADRMTIGVPFYGYGSGGWGDAYTYAQILNMNREAALHADEYNGIYFNGMDTIKSKTEYSKNYGGIMIWELGQDASGDDSLLKLIKDTLGDAIGDPAGSDTSTGGGTGEGGTEETAPSYEKYEVTNGDYYLSCSQDGITYKVITAANDVTVPLTAANDSYTGINDVFVLINNEDGTVSFQSAANGKYVCADINNGGLLLPRSDSIDTWEKFNLVKVTDTQCALLALSNNKYVSADFGNGGKLTAMSDSVAGAWEVLVLTEALQNGENEGENEEPSAGDSDGDGEVVNTENDGSTEEENTENSGSTEESTENVDSTEEESTENVDSTEEESTENVDSTEEESTESAGSNDEEQKETGTYPAWSATGSYKAGDLVSYDGNVYECILAHDANPTWIPGEVGLETIWKIRTDLVHVESGTTGENNNGSTEGDNNGSTEGDNNGVTEGDNNGSTEGDNDGVTDEDNSSSTVGDNNGVTEGDNDGVTDEDNNSSTEGDNNGVTEGGNDGVTDEENSSSTEEDNSGSTEGDNDGVTDEENSSSTGGDNSGLTGGDNSGSTGGSNTGVTGGSNTGAIGNTNVETTEETIDSVVAGVSSLTAVTKLLESNTTDEDVEGSTYAVLSLRVAKATNTSHKLKWNKVASADGYVILTNKCGEKLQVVKTITNGKTTSWNNKKLKKATYYKYVVVAYKTVNGKQITISTSKLIHVPTSGGKYTDVKAVKVNKASVTLKKGKTFNIKAKDVKKVNSKKISRYRKLCYESTNEAVATVSKSGKITAKSKGMCYIYVYAQNGVSKKVKVTVK